jgi:hypothetical protein
MASKHMLQGLIKWSMRDRWVDRFEQIFNDHLLPACDETGIEVDDITSTIGEDLFASTVWACAFEDFLTREFDGENAIDDYLKRRGWKETASVRSYMAAMRNSTMSLYEVSEIVRDSSFRARDLLRGGEPVLINEQSATRSLKPWDRIAARVVQVGPGMQISGGLLRFEHETAEAFLEAWRGFGTLSKDERRELAKDAIGEDVDDDAVADLSATEMLRASSSMFTTFWLIDLIDSIQDPEIPDLRNADGDELIMCEVSYPLVAGTTADDIQECLETCSEFRPTSASSWSWISLEKPTASGDADAPETLTFETWEEDGALVLGSMDLKDGVLVLAANSPNRADTGRALLSEILEGLVGQPSVKTESVEQMMASDRATMPDQLDIPEEDRCAVIHDYLDRHYRDVLDQPVAMLGGETPRVAIRTDSGRTKVADWLKMVENRTAKSAGSNNAMANYSFGWLWTELGISQLRR